MLIVVPIMGVFARRAILAGALALLFAACGEEEAAPAPSATPSATASAALTPTPVNPPCPATPSPGSTAATPITTPIPPPDLHGAGQGVVVGNPGVFSKPDRTGTLLRTLTEGQGVAVKAAVQGGDWAYGTQAWPAAYQDWRTTWFELADGGYVYRAFVYTPESGEVHLWEVPEGERWVDVDTGTQRLTAYTGDRRVHTAGVTTGKATTPTPSGSYKVWSRVESEVMASYDPADPYRVEHVLFTQYFSGSMHALHLNYWQPAEVFGNIGTSHGCVGLWVDDAQWLWLFGHTGMRVEVHE